MKKKPLISVIVPVYNVESYLKVCVDSILAQTYENLEIILVDDGSKDSSGKMCDEYAEKDARIKVVHKKNGGVSSARNKGLDVASGEYIGFVDSDDSTKPNMFEILYKNMVTSDADVSVCKANNCTKQAGDGTVDSSPENDIAIFNMSESIENIFIGRHFVGHVWNKLFKAELIDGIRFCEEISVMEDTLFSISAILRAKRVCFTKKPLYNYLTRQGSVLRRGFNENLLQALAVCEKTDALLKENGLDISMKKYFDTFVVLSDIVILRRLGNDKKVIKKYAPILKRDIKSHYNKESLPYMSSSTKKNMYLMMISWRLYFLVFKAIRTH